MQWWNGEILVAHVASRKARKSLWFWLARWASPVSGIWTLSQYCRGAFSMPVVRVDKDGLSESMLPRDRQWKEDTVLEQRLYVRPLYILVKFNMALVQAHLDMRPRYPQSRTPWSICLIWKTVTTILLTSLGAEVDSTTGSSFPMRTSSWFRQQYHKYRNSLKTFTSILIPISWNCFGKLGVGGT